MVSSSFDVNWQGSPPAPSNRPKGDSQPEAARRVERSDSNLARIIYGMIASGKAYDEEAAFKLTPANKARRIQRLIQQAQTLGLQINIAA